MALAGGGTGGHVYPSLAVAAALRDVARGGAPVELLYIGVRGRADENIVPRSGIPFRAVPAGQLRVSSPATFAANAMKLAAGVAQSLRILQSFKPDAVFATGGYASVPVGIAARILRRPLIVYLPDVTPGWAVRLLSRLATHLATTSERALAHLPRDRTRAVGYPVRGDFWSIDRASARARFGIGAEEKLLLITAGSLGARKINEAIIAALPELLQRCRILHLTGAADEARANEQRARLPSAQQSRYTIHGYSDDVPAMMIAADLVVSRAGASTLGELPAAGAASIVVPGEYEGWSQAPNAEYLQEQGAAVMLRNAELERLAPAIIELLADDARLSQMRAAARALARPDAARDIAAMLLEAAA